MSETTKELTVSTFAGLQVTGSVNLGLQDLVTVSVAKAEEVMRTKVNEFTKKKEALDKEHDALAKSLSAKIKEVVQAELGEEISAAKKLLQRFNQSFELKPAGELATQGETVVILVSLSDIRGSMTIPVTEEVMALYTELKHIAEEMGQVVREGIEWRRKLNKIPELERHFKAKVVTAQLSETEAGRSALDTMTANLDGIIDQL